jgi:hypothetical protein
MNKKMLIVAIIVLAVFLLGGVILTASALYYYSINFTSRDKQIQDYRPEFKKSNVEIYPGQSYYLYIKTDKKYSVGDNIDYNYVYSVPNSPYSKDVFLQTKVNYVGDGYVGIDLKYEITQPDCFLVFTGPESQDVYYKYGVSGMIKTDISKCPSID